MKTNRLTDNLLRRALDLFPKKQKPIEITVTLGKLIELMVYMRWHGGDVVQNKDGVYEVVFPEMKPKKSAEFKSRILKRKKAGL